MAITERILSLKEKTINSVRYLSADQARIITDVYKKSDNLPVNIRRALALAGSLDRIPISIDPEELIVGNRTPGIRAGVVFPEAGVAWLLKEIDGLPGRPQDPFQVRDEDRRLFIEETEPYWRGKTLEDLVYSKAGKGLKEFEKVFKINQKDHAQGHICPDVNTWLQHGPAGLLEIADSSLAASEGIRKEFFKGVKITLEASCRFMKRYGSLAAEMADNENYYSERDNLLRISETCNNLSVRPPSGFREAIQSVWFLFVILHMESNASSFSPGRMDQYLLPFYEADIKGNQLTEDEAQELVDALFIKFNHIVYLRNSHSARYFAGFPTGFNVTIGGRDKDGNDSVNDLTYLFLEAQDHCRMPQPNLTARLHRNSPARFIKECSRIIGLGTGMPQIANDDSIIPSLVHAGIEEKDSFDYVLVGCVELSTGGNYLGWSDAAMFNLVKVLELTLNDGRCMITGEQTGLRTGVLNDFETFNEFEQAYARQISHFVARMTEVCEIVEDCHQQRLPTPFLSSVTGDCLLKGLDVTAGGAKYNYSGIQAIQAANVADSMTVLKRLVFNGNGLDKEKFHKILLNNFNGEEPLRQYCINRIAKYGNDIPEVDGEAGKWIEYFYNELQNYRNYRGGRYQMGLYTVSAHVPMGANVGATPDGRLSGTPLADGGLSPMYGRDKNGPTALLNSVARIPSLLAANGTLLNMKFLPDFFRNESDLHKFESLIKSFVLLPVHHVQFNVVANQDLLKAKRDPESYRDLTIRVAGYTAFFTELAGELQDEIISRTTHG